MHLYMRLDEVTANGLPRQHTIVYIYYTDTPVYKIHPVSKNNKYFIIPRFNMFIFSSHKNPKVQIHLTSKTSLVLKKKH